MRGKHARKYKRSGRCRGKYHYRTMDEAEMEMERARIYRNEGLRPYVCEDCGSIHLTSWTIDRQTRATGQSNSEIT